MIGFHFVLCPSEKKGMVIFMRIKCIYIVLMLFSCILLNVKVGVCSSIKTPDLYQETAWINLDLPEEKRAQIDTIIANKSLEAKKLFKTPGMMKLALPATNHNQDQDASTITLLNSLKVMSQLNDIRMSINSEIESCLSPEQQEIFEAQLEMRERQVANTVSVVMELNLDETQQNSIISLLAQCQLQVWSIVSNTSLSWEDRRKKIHQISVVQLLTRQLTKDQQKSFKRYLLAPNILSLSE